MLPTPEPVAFLSYTHWDDESSGHFVVKFRQQLESELRTLSGRQMPVFHDAAIRWGENWFEALTQALDDARFLIAIITPSYLRSPMCRMEFLAFHRLEARAKRDDLILPLYYVECPELESEASASDEVIRVLRSRQYIDWRSLRNRSLRTVQTRERLTRCAKQIVGALDKHGMPTPSQTRAPLVRKDREPAVAPKPQAQPPADGRLSGAAALRAAFEARLSGRSVGREIHRPKELNAQEPLGGAIWLEAALHAYASRNFSQTIEVAARIAHGPIPELRGAAFVVLALGQLQAGVAPAEHVIHGMPDILTTLKRWAQSSEYKDATAVAYEDRLLAYLALEQAIVYLAIGESSLAESCFDFVKKYAHFVRGANGYPYLESVIALHSEFVNLMTSPSYRHDQKLDQHVRRVEALTAEQHSLGVLDIQARHVELLLRNEHALAAFARCGADWAVPPDIKDLRARLALFYFKVQPFGGEGTVADRIPG